MNAIETVKHGDTEVKILHDDDPPNPRQWASGVLYVRTNRYFSGDKDAPSKPPRGAVCLKVSAYIHSGVTIWTGEAMSGPPGTQCQWDAAVCGFTFLDPAKGEEILGENWQQGAEDLLRSEIAEYDMYLRGECYMLEVDGNIETSGIIGLEAARAEALALAKL